MKNHDPTAVLAEHLRRVRDGGIAQMRLPRNAVATTTRIRMSLATWRAYRLLMSLMSLREGRAVSGSVVVAHAVALAVEKAARELAREPAKGATPRTTDAARG